eukprot:10827165-Alexandrium_andersonii.AAC.1
MIGVASPVSTNGRLISARAQCGRARCSTRGSHCDAGGSGFGKDQKLLLQPNGGWSVSACPRSSWRIRAPGASAPVSLGLTGASDAARVRL